VFGHAERPFAFIMRSMSDMSHRRPVLRVQFSGLVQCDARAAGRLRLRGAIDSRGSDLGIVDIDLACDLHELPLTLREVVVERDAESGNAWRLRAGERSWDLSGSQVHLHHDIGARTRRLIAPRAVPLAKRLFWSALLTVLRFEAGRRWVQQRYSA
jgi:hypothetical protein